MKGITQSLRVAVIIVIEGDISNISIDYFVICVACYVIICVIPKLKLWFIFRIFYSLKIFKLYRARCSCVLATWSSMIRYSRLVVCEWNFKRHWECCNINADKIIDNEDATQANLNRDINYEWKESLSIIINYLWWCARNVSIDCTLRVILIVIF